MGLCLNAFYRNFGRLFILFSSEVKRKKNLDRNSEYLICSRKISNTLSSIIHIKFIKDKRKILLQILYFLRWKTKNHPYWGWFFERMDYLISLRRAAFPVSSRIYPIFFLRTLNCRRTTIFDIYGELIGKIFSIPIPSISARTVITFSRKVFPFVVMTRPRKIWIRSFSPSLMIWWTSTSIPVFTTGVVESVFVEVLAWIAAIRVESIVYRELIRENRGGLYKNV